MLKEYLHLIKILNYKELITMLNRELSSAAPELSKIMIMGSVLVTRYAYYHRIEKELLVDATVSLTLHLHLLDKDSVKLADINSFLYKEFSISTKYVRYSVADGKDFPFYSQTTGKTNSPLNDILRRSTVNSVGSDLPIRLRPIFYFYLDTGILMDKLLSHQDRFHLYRAINLIGGDTMIDTGNIEAKLPKTSSERIVFLSLLADKHPFFFMLLTLVGDFNKLVILTEILGNSKQTVPTTDDLMEIIDTASSSAEELGGGDVLVPSSDLANLVSKVNFSSDSVANTMVEHVNNVLDLEFANYITVIDRMSKRTGLSDNGMRDYFKVLERELMSQIKLFSKIKESSDQR